MAIATSQGNAVARIVDALGLKYVRSLRLNIELGSVVAIVAEQYVTGDQLERLAGELETKEWVLVPRDEIDRLRLTDAEREAVSDCLKFAFPATHPTAATLRGLLERTN